MLHVLSFFIFHKLFINILTSTAGSRSRADILAVFVIELIISDCTNHPAIKKTNRSVVIILSWLSILSKIL